MNPKPPSEMDDRERDDVRIGRNVRQYRLTRHLTQGQLAAQSGVSKARISEVERGAGCSVYVLMCLCHALGSSLLDMMAWRHWQDERAKAEDRARSERDRVQAGRPTQAQRVPERRGRVVATSEDEPAPIAGQPDRAMRELMAQDAEAAPTLAPSLPGRVGGRGARSPPAVRVKGWPRGM